MLRQIQVTWSNEDRRVIAHLRGDVDADATDEIRGIAIVADQGPGLTLDLADVRFVDIAGLDLLEDLARRPNVQIRNRSDAILHLLARTEVVIAGWPYLRGGG